MAVYVLIDMKVKNHETFEQFRHGVEPVIEEYGGRDLVRGGAVETPEGDWDHGRVVMLEFQDHEAWDAFYESAEYAPLRALRQSATESTVWVLQGV